MLYFNADLKKYYIQRIFLFSYKGVGDGLPMNGTQDILVELYHCNTFLNGCHSRGWHDV